MALELTSWWTGSASALAAAAAADLLLGDPMYAWHPVRLIGRALSALETWLRGHGFDGRGGGLLLTIKLTIWTPVVVTLVVEAARRVAPWLGWGVHVYFVYSFLALGDLLRHVWRVERAASRGDLAAARQAVSQLVGRDIDRMDAAACRRAAIESLSENLTDGFTSPLCWYLVAGLPGLTVFKVASTLDSMVGYKTPRYLRFGWAGARLDDVMNYVPARLTWIAVAIVAAVTPGGSSAKALAAGWTQHAILPGPNSGWSEAAVAGAIQRRLVGPIWNGGTLVTDAWIGDPGDPPASTHADLVRAVVVVAAVGAAAVMLGVGVLVR